MYVIYIDCAYIEQYVNWMNWKIISVMDAVQTYLASMYINNMYELCFFLKEEKKIHTSLLIERKELLQWLIPTFLE